MALGVSSCLCVLLPGGSKMHQDRAATPASMSNSTFLRHVASADPLRVPERTCGSQLSASRLFGSWTASLRWHTPPPWHVPMRVRRHLRAAIGSEKRRLEASDIKSISLRAEEVGGAQLFQQQRERALRMVLKMAVFGEKGCKCKMMILKGQEICVSIRAFAASPSRLNRGAELRSRGEGGRGASSAGDPSSSGAAESSSERRKDATEISRTLRRA